MSQQEIYECVYPYQSTDSKFLNISPKELMTLLEKTDVNWWKVDKNGSIGKKKHQQKLIWRI